MTQVTVSIPTEEAKMNMFVKAWNRMTNKQAALTVTVSKRVIKQVNTMKYKLDRSIFLITLMMECDLDEVQTVCGTVNINKYNTMTVNYLVNGIVHTIDMPAEYYAILQFKLGDRIITTPETKDNNMESTVSTTTNQESNMKQTDINNQENTMTQTETQMENIKDLTMLELSNVCYYNGDQVEFEYDAEDKNGKLVGGFMVLEETVFEMIAMVTKFNAAKFTSMIIIMFAMFLFAPSEAQADTNSNSAASSDTVWVNVIIRQGSLLSFPAEVFNLDITKSMNIVLSDTEKAIFATIPRSEHKQFTQYLINKRN